MEYNQKIDLKKKEMSDIADALVKMTQKSLEYTQEVENLKDDKMLFVIENE